MEEYHFYYHYHLIVNTSSSCLNDNNQSFRPRRCVSLKTDTLAEFRSFVMNNKAFGNLFCNLQKSFHTSTGSSDSNNRGYRSFFKLNNAICIYKILQTQQWHLHWQKILGFSHFILFNLFLHSLSIYSYERISICPGMIIIA